MGGIPMRIGSLARSLFCLQALAAALAALNTQSNCAMAQPATAGYAAGARQGRPVQALFTTPADKLFGKQKTPYVDAYGNPVVVPAGYGEACACEGHGGYGGDGLGFGHHGHHGGFGGPMPMGAGGTSPPVGYDLMNDVGIEGYMVDQRGPHYFDARVEAVTLTREETFERPIDFTIFNLGGPIVLSSSDLDYDNEIGFRAMGRFDLGPLSVFEFGYMGIYDFESSASFTDPNPVDFDTGNLFSLFSEFGTNPATVAIEGGPMPETERSITQSIAIDSDLQTAEMSYRRYWVGFIPRVSGTILAGFRYTHLKETFTFTTIGEARADNSTSAENSLTGFQTGGDVWIGLMQGLRLGAEGKVGIYNNHYNLNNRIETTPFGTTPPSLVERFTDNNVAFISEGSIDLVADILPSWSIRAGYEVLFLNTIVLAGDNFNTASPYGLPGQAPRVPFVSDQSDAIYHGGHVGVEFIW
jgi:hypothetical protein